MPVLIRRFLMLSALGLGFILVGCEQEGPLEQAGEEMDQAGERLGEGLEEGTEEAGEALER